MNTTAQPITVQLFYAHTSTQIWQKSLYLPVGSTVKMAIEQSGIAQAFPSQDFNSLGIGIFGQKATLNTVLSSNDRIELCRKLSFDPKESRKRRAQHRQAGILKKKHLKPDRAKKIVVDVHNG
ncbi:RnfH family protein [Pelistega europaea]|uniref:UPF0125 protein HKX40_02150 n=1 Tax=Pelistega europaea TaxID=106147 RepID=A0A7Y4P3Z2_9BURK|nr:RnfH family protein [Pelistega europaea]NOL48946.1 RnfH family protein [Pelistega europaea]